MSHETHDSCDKRLKEEIGKTRCCFCDPHKGCEFITKPHKINAKKIVEAAQELKESENWREETEYTGKTGWKKSNSLEQLQEQLIGEFEELRQAYLWGSLRKTQYRKIQDFLKHATQLAWEGGAVDDEATRDAVVFQINNISKKIHQEGLIAGLEKAKELVPKANNPANALMTDRREGENLMRKRILTALDQTLSAYKEAKI